MTQLLQRFAPLTGFRYRCVSLFAAWACFAEGCSPAKKPSLPSPAPRSSASPEQKGTCPKSEEEFGSLLVSWPADRRVKLKQIADKGIVAVRYHDCDMDVLLQCKVPGIYRYQPYMPGHRSIPIGSEGDLNTHISIGTERFREFREGGNMITVEYTGVADLLSESNVTARDQLPGECDGATHILSLIRLGAFEVNSSEDTGKGTDSKTTKRVVADGNVDSCKGENRQHPPDNCDRVISVSLHPLNNASITQISAGASHECVVLGWGAVSCAGHNEHGQLGNGTTENSSSTLVSGLGSGVAQVAVGYRHTCAVKGDGSAYCWGDNEFGQLGDGTTQSRLLPTPVSGLSTGVAQIAAGGSHTCALLSSGAMKCWGKNKNGQIGDGTTKDKHAPTAVSWIGGTVTAFDLGWQHTCAVTSAGAVKCWGANKDGQLGDGTTKDRNTPTAVSRIPKEPGRVALGLAHTCMLAKNGKVWCWGSNAHGALGDGSTSNSATPVEVNSVYSAFAIGTTYSHTCVLQSMDFIDNLNGALQCWGYNEFGQIGDGTTDDKLVPMRVLYWEPSGQVGLAVGGDHTCLLSMFGEATCWGANGSGQLANMDNTDRHTPGRLRGFRTTLIPQ